VWTKVSWESATLGLWFTGLLQRHNAIHSWIFVGRPKTFWMTGYFNPQGFLTSMQQEVARKHQGWALDDVAVFTEVQKMENEEVKEAAPEGVLVYGLFLEGCAWSKKENKLIDSSPKVLFHGIPVLLVTAVLATDKVDKNHYLCPVYRNKRRTGLNFICSVRVRSEDPAMKWILRGVSLLCTKD
jgi:dynein heavy chain